MTAKDRIRIGTWNVEYAYNRRNGDRLAALINQAADIWILTETHSSLDLSETHFSYPSNTRPILRNGNAGSTWVTIWSRFKCVEKIKVPDPLRQVAAVFDTPVGRLAVVGVVFPWHCDKGDKPVTPLAANWSEHKRVLHEEVPILLKSLSEVKHSHRVLAGDFNTDLAPPYSYGPGRVVRDEWHELLRTAGLVCHTKAERYPDLLSRNLIDHVCTDLVPPQIITTWSGEDGRHPRLSDHPGVVAEFFMGSSCSGPLEPEGQVTHLA